MIWKKINIDGNHPLWNNVFSKALKLDTMQYDETLKNKTVISRVRIDNRIQKLIEYKIVVEFQDELQSSFDIYQKLEF